MAAHLTSYIGKRVSVTETDGRLIVGKLRGIDNFTNLVLESAELVQLSSSARPEFIKIGSTIIRGDDVCFVALVDTTREASLDRNTLRFPPSSATQKQN